MLTQGDWQREPAPGTHVSSPQDASRLPEHKPRLTWYSWVSSMRCSALPLKKPNQALSLGTTVMSSAKRKSTRRCREARLALYCPLLAGRSLLMSARKVLLAR